MTLSYRWRTPLVKPHARARTHAHKCHWSSHMRSRGMHMYVYLYVYVCACMYICIYVVFYMCVHVYVVLVAVGRSRKVPTHGVVDTIHEYMRLTRCMLCQTGNPTIHCNPHSCGTWITITCGLKLNGLDYHKSRSVLLLPFFLEVCKDLKLSYLILILIFTFGVLL